MNFWPLIIGFLIAVVVFWACVFVSDYFVQRSQDDKTGGDQ